MADIAKNQQRAVSKTTVNTVLTKTTTKTLKSESTNRSRLSQNGNVKKSILKVKKDINNSKSNQDEEKEDKAVPINQNVFDMALKVNKNKLRVLEKVDFFDKLRDINLEIDVREDFVILRGKTQQIIDQARYQIDKQCKEVVTRLDNIGNFRSRFLRKPEVMEYVNFMLLQERMPCSWEVNDKVFDLLIFSTSQDMAVEGSKIIKNCIQSVEVENEQLEIEAIKNFIDGNKKVMMVPRKKKGDTLLLMTNDEFVKYQRILNPVSADDDGEVQIVKVKLPSWKIGYFKRFGDLKLKALCNMYKIDHKIYENHIELHGRDPSIVHTEIENMAKEIFVSLEHNFGNAPNLTKTIEDKIVELEKKKHCLISVDNKALMHSGWLGNGRDAMMHIISFIGPVETSECDVLLCPVTTDLQAFGCVKDVFRIGGKSVSDDISKLLIYSDETGADIEPEEIIVLQNTGNLKCQMLLLTVIPPWTRKLDVTLSMLYNCARKIINIVAETGYRSIGIPLDIADDFPSQMYASILVNNFWKLRKKFGHFVHLYGYADTLSTVEDFDEFLVSEIIMLGHMSRIVFDKSLPKSDQQTSNITMDIVEGSIVDMDDKVDVIVNATNHKDLEYGVVSRQLVQKAGREIIVPEYLQAYPNGIGVCDVAVTQPGNLKCQKIFHGCLFGWIMNGDLSERMLKLFVTRCLREAEKGQYTSIAFPALGSSLLVFPPCLVAKVMFKAVEKFRETENPKYLKQVDFVLNPIEKEVIEIFKNVQDWMVSGNDQLCKYDLPPKYISCIHKKHGIRFMVAMSDHYKEIKYKEVKVTIAFVTKESQAEIGNPVWDMANGSYTVTIKTVRVEKDLEEVLQKMVQMMEVRRFHIIDIFLMSSKESAGIIKESRPSSFGPWIHEESPKQIQGMSLQKQIDLLMTKIIKNTDKIYDENTKSHSTSKLSYIRVIRMFASTTDFKDMMKKLKKGGIEGGHGETSSWHIYSKKPQVYKYHIQAIGKKDQNEAVLGVLKKDIAHMEIPKKVIFKIAPPVKKVSRKIYSLRKVGYHISLDEPGKKAILEGTTKEAEEIRKELEEFIDNTLNINLSEDDYATLLHIGKKDPWFKQVVSNLYEKGTMVLTLKKGTDPETILKSVKSKMEDIHKMSEVDIPLQKKMTIFLEEIEKEVENSIGGVFAFLSFSKKRIIIKALNIKKAQEAKYSVQVKIGMAVPLKKHKKKKENQSKETTELKEDLKNGYEFTSKEGINLLVYTADFKNLKVETLVSPANKNLQHTKGIALNILQAAGEQIEKEFEEHLLKKGELIIGTCCSTKAGNLPYHCIIHTFGPMWQANAEQKKCLGDLKAAIVSALHEANAHNHKSVAFTAIGTGHYGIPKPFCAIQYYKGVEEYGKHMNGKENYIKDVHFIDSDENVCRIISKTFSKYLGEGRPI